VGSFATKAKDAVDQLRKAGHKVGLVRPRLLRPFPADAICRQLSGKKAVAVIDQNLSLGKGGVLQMELLSVLYGRPDMPPIVTSFVGGLGGRDISPQEFYEIEAVTRRAIDTGETPPTRLLYTDNELREMRKLQAIARVEQDETSPLKWQRGAKPQDRAEEQGHD
jgi:pyruvate ferredoxin oxidoreductase alpha subunit